MSEVERFNRIDEACRVDDSDGEVGEQCWICLSGSEHGDNLELPCACPRPVHLRCLARWNLQSAGRTEEVFCRFCSQPIPDWRTSLTPKGVLPAMPVMAIKFEGKTYKLKVKPGPEGLKDFKDQVRMLLGFEITDDFEVCFEASLNGEIIKLAGLNSYGAATHCAAITAGERERKGHSSLSSSMHHQQHLRLQQNAAGVALRSLHHSGAGVSRRATGNSLDGVFSAAQVYRQQQAALAATSPAAAAADHLRHGLPAHHRLTPLSLPRPSEALSVHSHQPTMPACSNVAAFASADHALSSPRAAALLGAGPAGRLTGRDVASWLLGSPDEDGARSLNAPVADADTTTSAPYHPAVAPYSHPALLAAAGAAVPSVDASIQGKPVSTKFPSLVKSVSRMAKKTLHKVFSKW